MKKLRVTIEGKSYDVLVEVLDAGAPAASGPTMPTSSTPVRVTTATVSAPLTQKIDATAAGATGGAGDVRSPLSGKIVSIDVKVGATIAEGAQVATIEAMKMNTYIFAPKGGRVTTVLATPGDGVEEGALLLQIE